MCVGWGEHRLDTSAGWADRGKRRVREHILGRTPSSGRARGGYGGEYLSNTGRAGGGYSKQREGGRWTSKESARAGDVRAPRG